jgi:uncharacterized protein YecE (DUF72 family)
MKNRCFSEVLTVRFFLGCAVWAYKGWVGEFYPQGTRPNDFLQLYSRRFTTVEGNTTFYAVPKPENVTRWKTETPANFQFCLKLPRDITHNGKLQPYIGSALDFLEKMRLLDNRLGPVFAQLPPSYSPDLIDDLTIFLQAWQQTQVPLALEVRHPNWFKKPYSDNLNELLTKIGVGRVLLDSRPIYIGDDNPQLQSERRKPKLPVEFCTTASFSLIRFISHPDLSINQPFMTEWVNYIKQCLQQGKVIYFFVHCPIEEKSPTNARYFQSLLEQAGAEIPPLPWNQVESSPHQLNLW